ncbi:tetratricopeptide repeat protein [Myxosarcina sp. GI1]|uniref:protein kinase domain-containing protein n=1 Tax=Myxosarcina sp. GI1 TaxID=1541065 RepID=UPI00055AEAC9|nr:tetratricopeptide repeat protein [Myxosarcina sp. GI1]
MPDPKPQQTDSAASISSSNKIYSPGAIVGHYQIVRQLGKEKADKIYLAKDLKLEGDARCVIEQLVGLDLNSSESKDEVKACLVRQLEVFQRLSDRLQVPQYRHFFIDKGQIYLVREYINGETLKQKIEGRTFNEAQTIHLLHDVLKTLDLIHKNNLIHQAIVPANLVERQELNSYALVKFSAFNPSPNGGSSKITVYAANNGYIAPEQQIGKPRFSSDIYGLGKTAIYALTGLLPRNLKQTSTVWYRCCQVSERLVAIIEKMTAANHTQRYHNALEVLADLKPLLFVDRVIDGRYRIIRHLQQKGAIDSYLAENLRRSYQSPCILERVELSGCDAVSWQKIEQSLTAQLAVLEKLNDCPQIPQLWDHFQQNGEFYLVKAYVGGKSLRQILSARNFSEAEVLNFLKSALAALAFVHKQRIIHRYISPENLLIDDRQRVVLTGLGILEDIQVSCQSSTDERQTDYSEYFAPEQIAGRATLSSDIYALGIIAIEALTGIEPKHFKHEQTANFLRQKAIVSNRLTKIIAKMTASDVGKRYQAVEKAIADLRKVKVKVKSQRVFTGKTTASSSGELRRSESRWSDSPSPSEDGGLQSASGRSSVHSEETSEFRRNKLERSDLVLVFSKWSLQPGQILIATLGIVSLLASIEFAFPFLRPAYYWYRGRQLLSQQPQIALNAFARATELQPNSYLAWEGKGDALYNLKYFNRALTAYDRAGELNANDFQNWQKQADVYYRLEKFPQALAAYNRALKLKPSDRAVLNSKGKTLENLQRYEEALSFHEAALKGDRLNAEFLSDRARVLIRLGRYYDALAVLDRARNIEPNSPQLWQDKVFALQALGRFDEADRTYRDVIATYQDLVEQSPANYSLWLAKGDFLTQLRITQSQNLFANAATDKAFSSPLQIQSKAIAAYEEATAISPESYLAWIGKAKTFLAAGEYRAALTALDRASEIRPQADRPWQMRGSILKDGLERPIAAVTAYERAIELNPDYAALWRDRGLALIQAGQYARAVASFTKASQLNPQDSETWVGFANALQAVGRQEKAINAIDRALDLEPQNPLLWQTKGSILTEQQNYDAACDTYRKSRQFAPDFAPITQAMNIVGCRMSEE